MSNIWTLPRAASIGGVTYPINADYRDILQIISYLIDDSRPHYIRWQIAIGLFYDGEIPEPHQEEAMRYLSDFISYGASDNKPGPKLIDWDKDASLIVADVNKVAGEEIRAVPFLHWWTFLSYFYGIGEGQLSTVVAIRSKKAKGKKLEKWEQEYYRENKARVDMRSSSAEEQQAKDNILKWL